MKKNRFPYWVYSTPAPLLAIIGLLASIYLAISHYRNYTDVAYSSFCAISKSINCDTVSQSSWSILFGLPLALWGILAYTITFIISLLAQKNTLERRYLWELLFSISFLFTIADIYFGYIASIKIKSYCIVCLLTYGVSMGLLLITYIVRKRFNVHPLSSGMRGSIVFLKQNKRYLFILLTCLLTFVVVRLTIPTYWIYQYPELSKNTATGLTAEGNPWIGAVNPDVTINEFTDYQCFECSKAHLMLRILVDKFPDRVRLVHHHYPMDEKYNTVLVKEPFHTGSGELALLAIAAAKQGKFWQTNDALYGIGRQGLLEINTAKFTKKLDLEMTKLKKDMYSEDALKKLESDIRTGLKKGIPGTPSFIINGVVYVGHIPLKVLNQVFNEE